MPQITPTSVNRTQPRRLNAPLLPTPATCNDHAGPRPIPLRLPLWFPVPISAPLRLLSPSASTSYPPPLPPPLPLRPMLVNVHLLDEPKVTTRPRTSDMPTDVTAGGWVGNDGHMPTQFDPPSGTRDFLAGELLAREHAFGIIRSVFARYGFEPLQTPAFERLEVLTGKYGDESDQLIFKILRRGEHEASGDADLALRYDLTVPLARVAAAYGNRLPSPYKRYAIGPVWRADRPGRGRYREFVQCDLDTLGSPSPLADAEIVCAVNDALTQLGIGEFTFLLNSRQALSGLLEAFGIHADLGSGVLITLDKLDKLAPDEVTAELGTRGLSR